MKCNFFKLRLTAHVLEHKGINITPGWTCDERIFQALINDSSYFNEEDRIFIEAIKPHNITQFLRMIGILTNDIIQERVNNKIENGTFDLNEQIVFTEDIYYHLSIHDVNAEYPDSNIRIVTDLRKGKGMLPDNKELLVNCGIPIETVQEWCGYKYITLIERVFLITKAMCYMQWLKTYRFDKYKEIESETDRLYSAIRKLATCKEVRNDSKVLWSYLYKYNVDIAETLSYFFEE